MDVVIVEVRRVGAEVRVYGTINGEGYRVTLPAAEVDTGTRAARQRVLATALKNAYDAAHGVPVDLVGTVRV